jgi:hypothetical protein
MGMVMSMLTTIRIITTMSMRRLRWWKPILGRAGVILNTHRIRHLTTMNLPRFA